MSPSVAVKENGATPTPKAHEVKVALLAEKTSSNNDVTNNQKLLSLRDTTQRVISVYNAELGSSSDQFLASCQSVEVFFDAIAGIRLRQMPHNSSRWDRILKWAEFFTLQVLGLSEEVSRFAAYSEQASHIIWASSLALIQVRGVSLCNAHITD